MVLLGGASNSKGDDDTTKESPKSHKHDSAKQEPADKKLTQRLPTWQDTPNQCPNYCFTRAEISNVIAAPKALDLRNLYH